MGNKIYQSKMNGTTALSITTFNETTFSIKVKTPNSA
jgi:hypothetical protein